MSHLKPEVTFWWERFGRYKKGYAVDTIAADVEWSEVFIQKAIKGDELTGFRSISSWISPFLEARVLAHEVEPDWKLSSDETQPQVPVKVEHGTSFHRPTCSL